MRIFSRPGPSPWRSRWLLDTPSAVEDLLETLLFKLAFNTVWLHRKIFEPDKDTISSWFLPSFLCLWFRFLRCSCCRLSLWVSRPPRSGFFWYQDFGKIWSNSRKINQIYTWKTKKNSKFSQYICQKMKFKKKTCTTDHNLIGFI
jgi:hypothetical protein